jgi:hypothetical protein
LLGEFFPRLGAVGAGAALANEDEVGPRDGLVIKLRFPLRGGEALQSSTEPGDGFKKRILSDIGESDADVVGMVEASGSAALLEVLDQIEIVTGWDWAVAGHYRYRFLAAAFFSAGLRLISVRRWLAPESRSRA